jgi:hypothetical protein
VEDVAGEALGVDPDNRRGTVDVAHDEGDGSFDAARGCGEGVVAGVGVVDDALEAEDAEVSPSGRKVGVGYLGYGGEGHLLIIRFSAHMTWIRLEVGAMQVLSAASGRFALLASLFGRNDDLFTRRRLKVWRIFRNR